MSTPGSTTGRALARALTRLRPGTPVQVKSEEEILATLDEHGTLEGLPFTAEMRQHCGRTFFVMTEINRICVEGTGVRSIDAVILSEAMCDGSAHGGCQRACQLLFKKAWLAQPEHDCVEHEHFDPTSVPAEIECEGEITPCHGQSATLLNATQPLSAWDIRQYIGDLKSGRMSHQEFACMVLFLLNKQWHMKQPIWECTCGGLRNADLLKMLALVVRGNAKWYAAKLSSRSKTVPVDKLTEQSLNATPNQPHLPDLDLQPGELVEVRSKEDIFSTLDDKGKCRGMMFGGCMLKFCGHRYRVLRRVDRFIDEKSNRMIRRISGTVILDGARCDGISFKGCPRACFWLWREAWLQRVQ